MSTLKRRLLALEACDNYQASQLPEVVADDTTDDEMARLRKHGRKVYRESDPEFIELFV